MKRINLYNSQKPHTTKSFYRILWIEAETWLLKESWVKFYFEKKLRYLRNTAGPFHLPLRIVKIVKNNLVNLLSRFLIILSYKFTDLSIQFQYK